MCTAKLPQQTRECTLRVGATIWHTGGASARQADGSWRGSCAAGVNADVVVVVHQ